MDLIRHSVNWARGEIFEMTVIALSGVAVAVAAVLFSKFGTTPLSKAMLVPLAVVGLFFATLGISGYVVNRNRIPAFERAYSESPAAFARAEKDRVERFQLGYKVTLVVAPIAFALAACLFALSLNPHARAIGMALVVFGLYGLMVDGFSKERADSYYERVLDSLPLQSK